MTELENMLKYLQSPECAAEIAQAMEKAQEKYKPLHDWEKAHKEKPKNLYEAVMRRESYKAAYEKVYGQGSY